MGEYEVAVMQEGKWVGKFIVLVSQLLLSTHPPGSPTPPGLTRALKPPSSEI